MGQIPYYDPSFDTGQPIPNWDYWNSIPSSVAYPGSYFGYDEDWMSQDPWTTASNLFPGEQDPGQPGEWVGGGDTQQPPAPAPDTRPPYYQSPEMPPGGASYPQPDPTASNRRGTGYQPGQTFYDYSASDDPYSLAMQDRMSSKAMQDTLDQGIRDTQNWYQENEGDLYNRLVSGPGGYSNIWAGQGGYSPEASQNILQTGLTQSSLATPQELDDLSLRGYEHAQIAGTPWQARDEVFGAGGRSDWLTDQQNQGSARQREAATGLESGLGNAIHPGVLRVAEDYLPKLEEIISSGDARYAGLNDPGKLGLSQEFLDQYQFGDRDSQDIVDAAGRGSMLATQAQNEALERAAAAQGNTAPLALASANSRNRLQGDIAANESMTDARILAKQLGLDTSANREQLRLAAERDMANRAFEATGITTGQQLAAKRDYETQRSSAERDISDRLLRAASESGQARLGTEKGIADAEQSLGRYQTDMFADLTLDAEREAARRAAELAANRQNSQGAKLSTRFSQGMSAADALSGRYGTVYGQQKAEEAEGRGAMGQLGARQQEGALTSQQQRLQNATGLGSLTQQGTKTAIEAKQLPSIWDKLIGAGMGAASTAFAGG